MSLTIGRVGTDITLYDPAVWSRNGNVVTLSGDLGIGVTTVADAVTLTEQLLGLMGNPDEPFVACTWTQEPWFDGYYRVGNVSAGSIPVSLNVGVFPYSITLEKLADGASPTIDVSLLGALRTNSSAYAAGLPKTWAPAAMQGGYARGGVFNSGTASVAYNQLGDGTQLRTTETGTIISAQVPGVAPGGTASAASNAWANFDVAPVSYYNGSCTVRSGTTLRRVIGSRMKSLPTNWEISNGLIRVTPGANSTLILELWDGAQWESTSHTFMITHGSGSTSNTFATSTGWGDISVVRNSPECAVIRLRPGFVGGNAASAARVDVIIQRGKYVAEIFVYSDTDGVSGGNDWGIAKVTASAATTIGGAIRQTSNDASGNRWVIAVVASSGATTDNLVQGGRRISSGFPYMIGMIGMELNGSTASSWNDAVYITQEWYYPIDERMAPRAR